MNCQDARDLLVLEADEALEHDERSALDVHVARCPSCQAERARTSVEWLAIRAAGRSFLAPHATPPSVAPNGVQRFDLGLESLREHRLSETHADGPANGRLNGHSNGHTNGHANGHGNGHSTNGRMTRPMNGLASRLAADTGSGRVAPVSTRSRRSPRGRRIFAGLIAAAVLLGGLYAANHFVRRASPVEPGVARPVLVASAGRVVDTAGLAVEVGSALPAGEPLSVSSASATTIRFARGDEITLSGEGTVRFEKESMEVVSGAFHLAMGGGVLLRVPGATVRTSDPDAEVEVKSVRSHGAGHPAELVVLRGHVDVTPAGLNRSVRVGTNEQYPPPGGKPDPGPDEDGDQNVKGWQPGDGDLSNSHQHVQSPKQEAGKDHKDNLAARALLVAVRDRLTGLPVPGVLVGARSQNGLTQRQESGDREQSPGGSVAGQEQVVTDADGVAVLWSLEPGDYEITGVGPWSYGGRATEHVVVTDGLTTTALVLSPAIVVSGQLTDGGGAPLAGFLVADVRTDEAGRFALPLEHGLWREVVIVSPTGRTSSLELKAQWSSGIENAERASKKTDVGMSGWRLVLDELAGFDLQISTSSGEGSPNPGLAQ